MNRSFKRAVLFAVIVLGALVWGLNRPEISRKVPDRQVDAPLGAPEQSLRPTASKKRFAEFRALLTSGLRAAAEREAWNNAYDKQQLNEDKLARTPEEHAAAGLTTLGLYATGEAFGWFDVARSLRGVNPELSAQVHALSVKLAGAGRPHAEVDLAALMGEERAMLQQLRTAPGISPLVADRARQIADNVEAMASGHGPSVAERLAHEAQQPIEFQRRSDDDPDKSEPED